jgi:hypothetical protein
MNPTTIKNIILTLLQELRNDKYMTKNEILEVWDLLNKHCRKEPTAVDEVKTVNENKEYIYHERGWN